MKQSEARTLILKEWDHWIQTRTIDPGGPTGKDSLKFFHELQDSGSPLLDFQSRGQDKWRIIHGWLLERGAIVRRLDIVRAPDRTTPQAANDPQQM